MNKLFILLFLFLSYLAQAQTDTTKANKNISQGNKNQQIIGNRNKQAGRDIIEKKTVIINNAPNHIVDSSKHINIENYYEIYGADTVDLATNFNFKLVDSTTLIVYPKVGKWEMPFVTVAFNEKNCLGGIGSGGGMMMGVAEGAVPADQSTYSCWYESPAATAYRPEIIKLNCLPSSIAFGDMSDPKKKYVLIKK